MKAIERDVSTATVEQLIQFLEQLRDDLFLEREWYTLDEACQLKGIHLRTAQNQPWLQPNGGTPDGIVGRKKRWRKETINKWLELTDTELRP